MDSATRAAWIAAFAALLSLPISLHNVWADRVRLREDLTLSVTAVPEDYPTQLNEVPGPSPTGTVSSYWSILIANNSDRDVSVVEYDIQEIRGGGDKVRYRSLKQGLFTPVLSSLDLPLNIQAGNATRFYLKVGLLMDAEAFAIAKDYWQVSTSDSLRGLLEHLILKDFDIYGKLSKSTISWIVKKGSGRGQIFLVTFRTARRTGLQATFSSSLFNLLFVQLR